MPFFVASDQKFLIPRILTNPPACLNMCGEVFSGKGINPSPKSMAVFNFLSVSPPTLIIAYILGACMSEPFRDRWLQSLPASVRDLLEMTPTQMNDFSDNVRMGDFLSKLAFSRVVEAMEQNKKAAAQVVELDDSPIMDQPEMISDGEINYRLSLAMKANEASAKLKEQRVALLDKYSDVSDIPVPIPIEFHVVESTPEQQRARLKALGRYKEEESVETA